MGVTPPDAEFKKMLDAYNACVAAGVEVPKKVYEFFNHSNPDPRGLELRLKEEHGLSKVQYGFDVELAKLPKNVKILKFVLSY